MPTQPSLILLRGLPGAGKSTLAAVLSEQGRYPVFSIDSYFTNEKGEYRFKFEENHLAYRKCLEDTEEAVSHRIPKIILDNTFTLEWEMEPYFRLATQNGYSVFVATVENRHGGRNNHGISDEQLRRMAEKYHVKLL